MATKRFVIFTGQWEAGKAREDIPKLEPEDFIVCADGGYILCKSAGIKPEAVIGDFDSLPEVLIREIESLEIECEKHPREKDETDMMLCVKYGLARGFDRFIIIGGIGGEFGHTMANLQVLSYLTDMEREAKIVTERETIFMADGSVEFSGRPGAKFSVLSYTERSTGVYIKNAGYELSDACLTQSYPVGVSNEFSAEGPVKVSVRDGRLLIISER